MADSSALVHALILWSPSFWKKQSLKPQREQERDSDRLNTAFSRRIIRTSWDARNHCTLSSLYIRYLKSIDANSFIFIKFRFFTSNFYRQWYNTVSNKTRSVKTYMNHGPQKPLFFKGVCGLSCFVERKRIRRIIRGKQ